MARVRGALVLAVFVGVAASLPPTHAALATTRARAHEVAIDATAVVIPEVVATPRRTTVRDGAHLLERLASTPLPILLLLFVLFAALAFDEVASRSRLRVRRMRTRAPPSLSRVT